MMFERNNELLDLFLQEIRQQLGSHLKQVILFGSRARGEAAPDSDYDCLAVVDEVSPMIKDGIDQVAGELLYQYNVVFSVFPIPEDQHRRWTYNPLLMNVRKEGIVL